MIKAESDKKPKAVPGLALKDKGKRIRDKLGTRCP